MTAMISDNFCCPICKGDLIVNKSRIACNVCQRIYDFRDGVADFFVGDMERDFVEDPNRTWLEPEIVEARDTVYRLCTRSLEGMAFCMGEIGRLSQKGGRILEVGMGTGHFTAWLHEVTGGTAEIFAFDFSWPIIEKAQENTAGLKNITLFRANARGPLPFPNEHFDMLFIRLAPLGERGKPNVLAGYELLKPGGWYFEGSWAKSQQETPPTDWAMQHGFGWAAHHTWQYRRLQTKEERHAWAVEAACLRAMGKEPVPQEQEQDVVNEDGTVWKMTVENLLMAQKPKG